MASERTLAIKLAARDAFTRNLQRLSKQLKTLDKSFKGMGKAASVSGGLAGGGIAALAGSVIKTGFSFNIIKEKALIAFGTLLGSGEKATKMFGDLAAFAEKTPFALEDLIPLSQRLLAFGFRAEQVIPTLTTISDAVASMGGGADMINRVTIALGQMKTKGKVSAEEMLQLTEAGIPAWQILAENMDKVNPILGESIRKLRESARAAGKTEQQIDTMVMQRVMKLAEAGKISGESAITALLAGMGARFGGLSEQQAETTAGAFSNLIDSFQQLAGAITEGPFAKAADVLKGATAAITAMREGFLNLPEPVRDMLSWFGTLLLVAATVAAGILSVALVLGGLSGAIGLLGPVFALLIGPVGWIALAILAIGLLAAAWANDWLGIRTVTSNAAAFVVGWIKWLAEGAWAILGWLINTATLGWGTFTGALAAGAEWVAGIIVGSWNWLSDTVSRIVIGIRDTIVAWWQNAVDWVSSIVASGMLTIAAWWDWLYYTVQAIVKSLWTSVIGWFASIIDNVISAFNTVSDIVQRIRDLINSIGGGLIGSIVATITGIVPGLAEGGIVTRPTLAMVGEGGAEAIVPLSGRGGGFGDTYNLTINYTGLASDIEDVVVAALDRARRRGRTV